MKALCISDLHARISFLPALEKLLSAEKFDLMLCAGDITNNGEEIEYCQKFISIANKLPFFFVPGNNEQGEIYHLFDDFSVEGKLREFKGLPADASPVRNDVATSGGRPAMPAGMPSAKPMAAWQAGEKIIGMGGVPDLWGHNIYPPKISDEEMSDSIFLSHMPAKNIENIKKFDWTSEKTSDLKLSAAPKIQISGHEHHFWGVGFIGKTKILKLPAGLNMMAAELDTENLKVKFIDMRKYDKVIT